MTPDDPDTERDTGDRSGDDAVAEMQEADTADGARPPEGVQR